MGKTTKQKLKNDSAERQHLAVPKKPNNVQAMQGNDQIDTRELIHELTTYQIELELQNEELRRAQQKLEEYVHRYTDLYDFAPVGYLTLSNRGIIVEANLTAADILGVPRGRLLNQPLAVFVLSEDQDIFYHHRKRLLAARRKQTCELRLRKKEGPVLQVRLESMVEPDQHGMRSEQLRMVLTDISPQKKLENDLRRSSEEWEKTFDSINDIITLQDKQMRIVRANKAAHAFFEAEPGGLNGKYCYEIFRNTGKPCRNCPSTLTLKNKTTHDADITHENLGKIFQVTSSVIPDENGEISQLVHIAKDITTQKKMEDALLHTHKMEAIGTLAGGIAHDFNNILTAIIGYTDLAREEITHHNHAKEYLDQVLNAGYRAKDLIAQILTFSSKDHQAQNPLSPAPVVKEALRLIRASLPATVTIDEQIDPGCSAIMANSTNIQQVIINLCTNALQAMEEEKGILSVKLGEVELREHEIITTCDAPGNSFIELMVRDTGHGMDSKTIKRIFEPYYSTRAFGQGSGMGLALVHGIVRGCNGFIKVDSEPGKGSTFHLYFPVCEEKTADDENEAATLKSAARGEERILVVDDEKIIVDMYKAYFEELGYQITAHTDSERALEQFRTNPHAFDLVITDQTMPRLPGADLAKKILQIRKDMPIILCTGYSSVISAQKAREIGIEKFLMKPVETRLLAATARKILDKNKEKGNG